MVEYRVEEGKRVSFVRKLEYNHDAQQEAYEETGDILQNYAEYLERDVVLLKSVCKCIDTRPGPCFFSGH